MADAAESSTMAAPNGHDTVMPSSETHDDLQSIADRPTPAHPALATSKRKFHKLLENLTKPPTQKRSRDALSTTTDSPAKRIRLEARARLETSGPAGNTVGARVQSQLLRSRLEAARSTPLKDADTETKKESQREPNYVPWSHDAFLRRLKTFADLRLWTSKPDAVNEVAWARRGWVCVGVNTVACKGGCEQRVVVGLRPAMKDAEGNEIIDSEDFSYEIEEDLVRRVEELIVQGHEDGCLWKDGGCRDDIYRLPIARPSVWQPQLRDRYYSFEAVSSLLPPSDRLVNSFDTEAIANLLPSELLQSHTASSQSTNTDASDPTSDPTPRQSQVVNHNALSFALSGWTGKLDAPGYALATCEACFRRLGLWLYAKGSQDANKSANQTEALFEDNEQDEAMRLDLVNNHRDHCPWVNGVSQAMPGSMAGLPACEVLRKCIVNDAGFRGVGSRPSTSAGHANKNGEEDASVAPDEPSLAPASTSKEDLEKEDKARFARLKELSKAIGLKSAGLRAKLGRMKTTDEARPSSAGVT